MMMTMRDLSLSLAHEGKNERHKIERERDDDVGSLSSLNIFPSDSFSSAKK
jgi:hypothetical protein